MLKLKNKFKKTKWFKEYEDKVLKVHHDYYGKTLEQIFGFDSTTYVYCAAIYDVVDNNQVNNLVKKLYALKKSKYFSIEINYRKKGLKNINYIRPEFDHTGHGIFAKVNFLNDSLISEVDMTWSQINNEEAIMEYEIKFKKGINPMLLYPELKMAHQLNDKAVWEAYGKKWNVKSESECVSELMKMYQELVNKQGKCY